MTEAPRPDRPKRTRSSLYRIEMRRTLNKGVELRAKMDSETTRGLQLINGGMAAGLIALLPAILREPGLRVLAGTMMWAVFFGGLGLIASVVHSRLRRKCSHQYSKKKKNREPQCTSPWIMKLQTIEGEPCICTVSIMFMWASLACFLIGTGFILVGFLKTDSTRIVSETACWTFVHASGQDLKFNTCTGHSEVFPVNK